MEPDVENINSGEFREPRTGFGALSRFLVSDADRFLMVFPRFDRLATQNLVYLQTELDYLQSRLEKKIIDDEYNSQPGPDERKRRRLLLDWKAVEAEEERRKLIKRIRKRMRDYREALLQQAALCNLDVPSQKTHDAILREIGRPGNPALVARAPERVDVLYRCRNDLVSARSPTFEDGVTSFVDRHFSRLFKTKDLGGSIYMYSHDQMLRAANVSSAVFAVAAMAIPIWGLYAVGRFVTPTYAPWLELTIMTVSTFLFVVVLGLVMNAKRSELFVAAATYLAVLVVFLSGLENPKSANRNPEESTSNSSG